MRGRRIGAAASLSALLAACSSAGEPPSGAGPTSSVPASRSGLHIAWVTDGDTSSYGCAVLAAARRTADADGIALDVHADSPTTPTSQVKALSAAISTHASAVVLDAVASGDVSLAVRFSHDQGVPVVLVGRPPSGDAGFAATYVDAADEAFGEQAAAAIAARAPRDAHVLVVVADGYDDAARMASTALRRRGIAVTQPVTITSPATAAATIEAALRRRAGVSAVLAADAPSAVAVAGVPAHPLIVALGGSADETALLTARSIGALVVADPDRTGAVAVQQALAVIRHRVTSQPFVPVRTLTADRQPTC